MRPDDGLKGSEASPLQPGEDDVMDGSIREVMARLESLERRVARLESRSVVEDAESGIREPAPRAAGQAALAPSGPAPAPAIPHPGGPLWHLTGRTLLVLAGAFLLRSLTDAGTLAPRAGLTLGLLYAATWFVLAARDAHRGRRREATWHGITAAFIGYPLICETTVSLDLLSPQSAAACLLLMTALGLGVALRWRLRAVAWAVSLATLGSLAVLYAATPARMLFAVLVLVAGGGTLWLAYVWRLFGIRWPAAILADLIVLRAVNAALRAAGEADPGGAELAAARLLILLFMTVYLGSIATWTLLKRRDISIFGMVQAAAVILIGLGGSIRLARTYGIEVEPLGWAALAAAAGAYAVAFAFVARHLGRGRNFHFYAWVALALVLAGSGLALADRWVTFLWAALALGSAALGERHDRATLRYQAAAYLAGTVLGLGLPGMVRACFIGPAGEIGAVATGGLAAAMIVPAACYAVFVAGQRGRDRRLLQRLAPRALAAVLAIGAAACLAVDLVTRLVGSGDAIAGTAVRSGILAASAIAVAATSRSRHLGELGSLTVPLLVAGGVKLVAQDLWTGQAVSIFLGFAFFGTALLLAPRLRQAASPAGAID
jgi:hypothetical protein